MPFADNRHLLHRSLSYLAVVVFGSLVMFAGLYLMRGSKPVLAAEIALAGIAIGVGGMVLLATGVGCPHCGKRLVLYAVKTYPAGSWLPNLLKMRECPSCEASFDKLRELD